jgi:hypothetical protein
VNATPKNNTAEGTEISFFKSLTKDFDPDFSFLFVKKLSVIFTKEPDFDFYATFLCKKDIL